MSLVAQDTETSIRHVLSDIGIQANLTGYHYLVPAIKLVLEHHNEKLGLYRDIYPATMEQCNAKTIKGVERAIAHAIELCIPKMSNEQYTEVFGDSTRIDKLSNSYFIYSISEYIKRK